MNEINRVISKGSHFKSIEIKFFSKKLSKNFFTIRHLKKPLKQKRIFQIILPLKSYSIAHFYFFLKKVTIKTLVRIVANKSVIYLEI